MKYTERIFKLKRQAPIFFNLMAQVSCLFNPFHDEILHFQGMTRLDGNRKIEIPSPGIWSNTLCEATVLQAVSPL